MTLRATVRGRVQGVGFRLFARDVARRLGLRGYVRNADDGSVEVVAAGAKPALDEFLRQLRQGPIMAYVSSVVEDWSQSDPVGVPERFEVRS